MKILAIGDFHGKFPVRLANEAKKADLILCTGDFANIDKIRNLIFKSWVGKKWYEVVGLKKAARLEKEGFDSGLKLLKKLNSLKKKTYLIWGNADFYKEYTTSEPPVIMPGYYDDKIKKLKNLVSIDKKRRRINEIDVVGYGGYVDATEFIKHPVDKDKKKQQKRLKRYKRDERKLQRLLLKSKPNKNFIFLIHYTPYGIFDKVKFKKSPMYKKHVGWQPYNKIIKKYRPSLVVCGHMHEYQGMKKLGRTFIVNPGSAYEGKAAIINFSAKGKVEKVKFIK